MLALVVVIVLRRIISIKIPSACVIDEIEMFGFRLNLLGVFTSMWSVAFPALNTSSSKGLQ